MTSNPLSSMSICSMAAEFTSIVKSRNTVLTVISSWQGVNCMQVPFQGQARAQKFLANGTSMWLHSARLRYTPCSLTIKSSLRSQDQYCLLSHSHQTPSKNWELHTPESLDILSSAESLQCSHFEDGADFESPPTVLPPSVYITIQRCKSIASGSFGKN